MQHQSSTRALFPAALLPPPLENPRKASAGLYHVVVRDFMTELKDIFVGRLPSAWLIVEVRCHMTLFLPHNPIAECDSLETVMHAMKWANRQHLDERWKFYGSSLWAFCGLLHAWEHPVSRLPACVDVEELRKAMGERDLERLRRRKDKEDEEPLAQRRPEKDGYIWIDE